MATIGREQDHKGMVGRLFCIFSLSYYVTNNWSQMPFLLYYIFQTYMHKPRPAFNSHHQMVIVLCISCYGPGLWMLQWSNHRERFIYWHFRNIAVENVELLYSHDISKRKCDIILIGQIGDGCFKIWCMEMFWGWLGKWARSCP